MRISQAIIEVEERLREDRALRSMAEKLEEDLIKQGKILYYDCLPPLTLDSCFRIRVFVSRIFSYPIPLLDPVSPKYPH
jgi:hypothetical protein